MKQTILILLIFLWGSLIGAKAQSQFAFLTDLHINPDSDSETYLKKIVAEINENSQIEFIVVAGDISNMGSDEELSCVKGVLDELKKPLLIIPGNHETNWSQSACATFNKLWGNDRFLYKHNNDLFIGFSTGPYMKMGDGHVKREDILWLEETLEKEYTPQTRIFIVAHYPLHDGLSNYRDVLDVLKKYPAAIQFCGHYHQLRLVNLEGNMRTIIGRAQKMGDNSIGYNIATITVDSLFYAEKRVDEPSVQKIAIPIVSTENLTAENSTPDPVADIPCPSNVTIAKVFHDNASLFSGIVADKERIYLSNSAGYVKAISKKEGKVVWEFPVKGSLYSTPSYTKGRVVIPATDGNIYGLHPKNGKKIWQITDGSPFVADGFTDGEILYQGGYKCFYKIDTRKGHVIWKSDVPQNYCQAQPTLTDAGDRILLPVWDTNLYCLDTQNGKEIWRWNNNRPNRMLSPGNCIPATVNNKAIIVAPDRAITAISLTDGKQLWRDREYAYRESMGRSVDGNTIYSKTMDGELIAVSSQTADFTHLWRVDTGIGYEHTPSPIIEKDGIVYLASRAGIVVAVDATTHDIIWRKKLGNSAVNRFFVDSDGSIYFTLIEGSIYRITITR